MGTDTLLLSEEVRKLLPLSELKYGELFFHNEACVMLSESSVSADFMVDVEKKDAIEVTLLFDGDTGIVPEVAGERKGWERYSYACLLRYEQELESLNPREVGEHKKYSREGMVRRVLSERRLKADTAKYRIQWADNIYGDHLLINEAGIHYKIYLRDFENETGYSNSADAKFNKLGTTKHIMYAFKKLKENEILYNSLSKSAPFVEIYCDPLNDYRITWFYPGDVPLEEKLLLSRYFGKSTFIDDTKVKDFLGFIEQAADYDSILVRPEVRETVERSFERALMESLKEKYPVDFSDMKVPLFPYQEEGVKFVLFRKAAIIADEMGLGKTIQAIAAAVVKKRIFGFNKTLIVCPATLKSQWKKEIERFTDQKALIVNGKPRERQEQYLTDPSFFFIVNYEMILRDSQAINKADFDFLILDEAQKIKNYETKTYAAINRLQVKQSLAITGTPIENRLIDLFSIISVLDPYFMGPLWEFSYQHCLFDPEKPNKINGYYNLEKLNKELSVLLIRREKREVLSQLPNVQQKDIPVCLSPLQQEYHAGYLKGVASIIRKKFLTPFDLQKLNLLLTNARMVCDSTYLVDEQTNESPKLEELQYILFEKLDIQHRKRKIIIFSEWIKVHKLIGQILRKRNIGFVELNGKVPVKFRGELIKKFEKDDECMIFLSTEAGGAGLNLQVADMLINFELPWNPAKKNQRIGRIDRIGQKNTKLTIYNLISKDSIEQHIAAGLLVKQNLFEGVFSKNNSIDYVDFSTKGRAQFIRQIESFINEQEKLDREAPEAAEKPDILAGLEEIEQLELFGKGEEDFHTEDTLPAEEPSIDAPKEKESRAAELEQVMNSGMQFFAGLYKMSTGKDLDTAEQKITVDKETGEVVLRFKI